MTGAWVCAKCGRRGKAPGWKTREAAKRAAERELWWHWETEHQVKESK